ncbi:MAG: type II toxin-antitoxin system RelE/ParE family toxin [bacterium]
MTAICFYKRVSDFRHPIPDFFFGKKIVLTHGFVKKTDRLPVREVERAERIMEDFL